MPRRGLVREQARFGALTVHKAKAGIRAADVADKDRELEHPR